MRDTSLHAHPISMHLRRHRECLERRCTERGPAASAANDGNGGSELSPRIRHRRPIEPLPFQARDDED